MSSSSEKVRVKPNAFGFPMPTVLVGTTVNGQPNFMAVGWITRVNIAPPMIAISIGNGHHTTIGLKEHKTFSVNVPGADMMEVTDYCGIVSGKETDKARLFDVFHGKLETAPMIAQCPLTMECEIVHSYEMQMDTLYVANIISAYSEEKYLDDKGRPDAEKINPFCLTMMDCNYWSLGKKIGKAWEAGKSLE